MLYIQWITEYIITEYNTLLRGLFKLIILYKNVQSSDSTKTPIDLRTAKSHPIVGAEHIGYVQTFSFYWWKSLFSC